MKGAPLIALRGFQRVHLEPGASQKVHFELKDRDLSIVTEEGNPIVAEGDYTISIGGGSQIRECQKLLGTSRSKVKSVYPSSSV